MKLSVYPYQGGDQDGYCDGQEVQEVIHTGLDCTDGDLLSHHPLLHGGQGRQLLLSLPLNVSNDLCAENLKNSFLFDFCLSRLEFLAPVRDSRLRRTQKLTFTQCLFF